MRPPHQITEEVRHMAYTHSIRRGSRGLAAVAGLAVLGLPVVAAAQEAAPPPEINAGDTAWMLVSTALVLLMTPALAFFYGGLVRSKNALNTMMMSFISLGFVGVLWALFGYSLAFTEGNNWIGDTSRFFLNGVGLEPQGTIPHLLFMCFQGTFCIITAALISGAIVERMRFPAYVAFISLWAVAVYFPLAHWVWGGDRVDTDRREVVVRTPSGDQLIAYDDRIRVVYQGQDYEPANLERGDLVEIDTTTSRDSRYALATRIDVTRSVQDRTGYDDRPGAERVSGTVDWIDRRRGEFGLRTDRETLTVEVPFDAANDTRDRFSRLDRGDSVRIEAEELERGRVALVRFL
jgi:hypothetical protein